MTLSWTRRDWLGLLATAPPDRLADLARPLTADLAHELLRPAEIGAVMTRGRMGGTGAPFNLGEMTVTRCSVRLGDGRVGHAWVQGRARDTARTAALLDALMQGPEAGRVTQQVLEPLAEVRATARRKRAAQAAATRVDFFTLMRGEDG